MTFAEEVQKLAILGWCHINFIKINLVWNRRISLAKISYLFNRLLAFTVCYLQLYSKSSKLSRQADILNDICHYSPFHWIQYECQLYSSLDSAISNLTCDSFQRCSALFNAMAGKSLSRPSNPSQRLNYSLLDLHTIVFISGEGVCRAIVNFDLQFLRPSTVMLSIRVYALWFQSRIVLIILLVTMTVRLKAISINPTSFTRVIRVVSSGHYTKQSTLHLEQ